MLVALAFIAFGNTLTYDYCWDDSIVILENSRVQKGISGIPSLFIKSNTAKLEDRYGYRPITLSTLAIEYQFSPGKPFLHHLMNVLYYALLCMLLFITLRKLFKGFGAWLSFLIVALFIVHPYHSEVVANIKSRDEILALLFSILSLFSFLQFYDHRKWMWLALSGVCTILAFLSKEGSLAFLAVLPLSIFLFRKGKLKDYLITCGPLAGVLLIGGIILLLTFPENTKPTGTPDGPEFYLESMALNNSFFTIIHPGNRLGNSLHLHFLYLKKFIWPYPLTYFSGYNQIPILSGFQPTFIISLIVLLSGLVFAFWKAKKHPLLSFAILYFEGTIFLYLQLFFILNDTFADRFMFAPSIGLCILLVVGIGKLLGIDFKSVKAPLLASKTAVQPGKKSKKTVRSIAPTWKTYSFVGILVIFFVGYLGRTVQRNGVWKDNMTLFSSDLIHLEECAKAHYYYADALNSSLETQPDQVGTQTEIIKHYNRAIEISDSSYYAFIGLADIYLRTGNYTGAEATMSRAVQYYPGQGDSWFFLGKARFFQEKFAQSATDLQRSVELNPYPEETWFLLALSYSRSKQFELASSILTEGITKFPQSNQLLQAKSELFFESERYAESFSVLETLIDREPLNPAHWRTMIGRYQHLGNMDQARVWYEAAQQKGIRLE